MNGPLPGTPPRPADDAALAALPGALREAGFTVEGIEERLGTHELSSRAIDSAVHLRRLGDDAFGTIARLFLLGLEVDAARLAEALPAVGPDALAELGLVERDGRVARTAVRLAPHGDYYVASDGAGADAHHDYVPGIQAPSVTLAKLAVRRRVAAALDLGTGCGIQALLAAKHARRVTATDVNPRALEFASFNARLNGVGSIELRRGSGFEPVAGRRFDLVVANPPYVVSPDAEYAYRDSGLRADELCRRLVGECPGFLEEDGFAHLLVSWLHDGRWAPPLRAWVEDSGCDAWLLHYRTNDPLTHAAGWLRPLGETDAAAYERGLDRWTAHLRELGAAQVGYGAVVLRRRPAGTGEGWVREDPLPIERLEPAGEHTLRVFAGCETARTLDDGALLEASPALTPHHVLRQELHAGDGLLTVRGQVLELTDGLRLQVGVDRHTASLMPHLDGRRRLREALAAAAGTFPLDEQEREQFVPAALPVVRQLLELGFLVLDER